VQHLCTRSAFASVVLDFITQMSRELKPSTVALLSLPRNAQAQFQHSRVVFFTPSPPYCLNHAITAPNDRLHPRSIKSYPTLNGDDDEKYDFANVLLGYGGGKLLFSIPRHYPALDS